MVSTLKTILRSWSLLVLLCAFPIAFMSCAHDGHGKGHPKAVKGVLDLTRWDFHRDGPVDLSGEWEFYWEAFLSEEDLQDGQVPKNRLYITVPGIWNGLSVQGREINGHGYATYRLKILLKPQQDAMAFKFLSMGTAYRLYVNGQELCSDGQVGTSFETMTPEWSPHVARYLPRDGQLDLVLHMSNFNHRKGGAYEAIKFGREQDLQSIREKSLTVSFFVCGGIFIMGIYHLVLFLLRRKDRAPLYFGIFCLFISFYNALLDERYLYPLFPWIEWELKVKITNLTYFLSVPFVLLYVHDIFPQEFGKRFLRTMSACFLLLSSVVLMTPARVYSHIIIPVFHVAAVAAGLYAICIIFLGLRRKREGSGILLVGTCIFVAAIINDVLNDHQIVRTGQLVHLGMFMFVFSQSVLLSRRFSKAFSTVETQSQKLASTNLELQYEIDMRRKIEGALIESEEKYRLVIENASEAIFILQDRSIRFSNRRTEELIGYSAAELSSMNFLDFLTDRDRETGSKWYTALFKGRKWPAKIKFRIIPKSGGDVWLSMNAVQITWEGRPAILCFAQDVTQEVMLEASLERAHKMEAIGTLAGGVAHDLNNVLSGIVSYPDLLLMQLPVDSPLRELIETIRHTGEKAAAIVTDLLTLARRGVLKYETVNLNDIILDYLKSPEFNKLKSFHPNVRVTYQLSDDLSNVKGSPFHLSKTIMNLVSNAAEAMPDGGTLTISTESSSVDGAGSPGSQPAKGEYAVVRISDTGVGISPEDREKIFEPFYTKKVMGRSGTGLGMAVVWGTVKDHNGHIGLESSVGQGTSFTLHFPATREEKTDKAGLLPLETYKGSGESILVVDDVREQREIASMMLRHLGYSVTAVPSGEAAVEYLKGHDADLLILDMIMEPGMDGLETYKRVVESRPHQKAIITSGFSETERVRELKKMGVSSYVRKPYTLETLGVAVKTELSV